MRVLFWRRRNKRFVTRMNTIVETAERSRQSLQPKPRRVQIDMSYVQPQEGEEGYEEGFEDPREELRQRLALGDYSGALDLKYVPLSER